MSVTKVFSMKTWFKELFGFEESVKSVYENLETVEYPDHVEIKSKVNKNVFNAGNFQIRSSDRSTYELKKKDRKGTLNIIKGNGQRSKHFELIDILTMQSLPKWNGATYLAASNFNCLEFVSSYQTAKEGVTSYYTDSTQGPYAALACGPAIVYRNYFFKHDGVEGQLDKEVNILSETPINVKHGYAQIKDDRDFKEIKNESGKKIDPWDYNWSNPKIWQVGVHRNCEVVMTRGPGRTFATAPPKQIAHHVYAAAFNFCGDVSSTAFTQSVTQDLLQAEYRATILAAWENSQLFPNLPGSNKLSLTLLGGGVFNNPYELICEAISANVDLIVESGLDVYITCFSQNTFDEIKNYLMDCVKSTNGKVYDTNSDESCKDLL